MRRTAEGKRVKVQDFYVYVSMDQGPVESTYVSKSWKAQDDYRLIGGQLIASGEVNSAGAYDEGDWQMQCFLTLDGTAVPTERADRVINGDILALCIGEMYHEETFGVGMNGDRQGIAQVMFPEGHGIDVDEGEYVYLSCQGVNRMGAAAGNMTGLIRGVLYLVER